MELNEIILPLIILVLTLLSRKYIEPIMPDHQIVFSYMKKLFSFIFRYALSIAFIVYESIYTNFDKIFVLTIVILFSGLIFQITLHIISITDSTHFGIHKDKLSVMEKMALEIEQIKDEIKTR